MKNFILLFAVVIFSSFSVPNVTMEKVEKEVAVTYYVNEDCTVTFCVYDGEDLKCCEAETYEEARDCARLM